VPGSPLVKVMEHLRKTVLRREEESLSDGQLVDRFVEKRDEVAFAALVRRHGPMVWGVCQRIVGNHEDADDAFQAAFLVLVRKAAAVKPREAVGNWLYGVACHTALKARAASSKVRSKEKQVTSMPEPARERNDDREELQRLFDQELSAMPDKYRLPVVLCELEGRTRKAVAAQLKVPQGTLSSRLATAHRMLAKRLARRGLAVSGGSLAALFAQNAASACVPAAVVASTIKNATLVAASNGAVAGVVSARVAALTAGAMKAMLISKLKPVIAVVMVLGFGTGATVHTYRTASAQSGQPPFVENRVNAVQNPAKERDKEAFTAWGKEINGLQAGLGYRPGQKRVYSHGETVKVVARVRNVAKEAVDFTYIWAFLVENRPTITDADGKLIQLRGPSAEGLHRPRSTNLAPGKEIELYEWYFELRPKGESGNDKWSTIHGTGTFSLQCDRIVGPTSANRDHPNPALSKLATGKLELEVEAAPPKPEQEKEPAPKPDDKAKAAPKGEPAPPDARAVPAQPRFSIQLAKNHFYPGQCVFLTDNSLLVRSGDAHELDIRDAKTGKIQTTVPGEGLLAGKFKVSNDRKWVAAKTTPDPTGTFLPPRLVSEITVWEMATWKVVGTIDECKELLGIGPDGRTVAVLRNGQLEIWDAIAKKRLQAAPFSFRRFDAAALSPDGKLLVVSADNEVVYWKWQTGEQFRHNVGRLVRALAFSPDGKLLAEGPQGRGAIEVRDLGTMRVVKFLRDKLVTGDMQAMMFIDGGATLLSASGGIDVWDVQQEKLRRQIGLERGGSCSLSLSPDGKSLAVVSHTFEETSLIVVDMAPAGRGAIRAPKDTIGLAIEAEVTDAAVGQLALGQGAVIMVDAFLSKSFRGKVHAFQKAGKGTMTVVVEFLDPNERLAPGMTASVQFLTVEEQKREQEDFEKEK
jgi:RNA polymerase sigma factor (sigma-70 family)